MDQDGLAFDRLIAKPLGLAEFRVRRRIGFCPARLPPGPADFEIAGQHVQQGQIPVGRGVIQMQGPDVVIAGESLVEPLQLAQHEGLVVQDLDSIRQMHEGLIEP
jgi:hypothetical protein